MENNTSQSPCVVVCVTDQSTCERLIETGRIFAQKDNMELHVINIQPARRQNPESLKVLSDLYEIAKSAGAQMTVYFNDEPVLTTAAHIMKYNAVRVIAGLPGKNSSGFLAELKFIVPDVELNMVDMESNIFTIPSRVNV